MLGAFYNDTFIFSALKTHAQLLEASRLLLTDDGKVKSFAAFSKDIAQIKSNYNQHYLEAEYQFAITSAQMGAKWANLSGEYDLQYRTAADDRVRASHQVLHNITLPSSDAFWLYYYPPNGWRCRCNAVEVRRDKYDLSDSAAAILAGEKATTQLDKDGNNKLAIFRFNPGAEKKVFPPAHPYQKVTGAKEVKQNATDRYNEILDELIYSKFLSKDEIVQTDWHKKAIDKAPETRPSEAMCLRKYTGNYYENINRYLRNDRQPQTDFLDAFEKLTNSALDKIEKPFTGTVYRGTKLPKEVFDNYYDAFMNKSTVIEKHFLSTSSDVSKKFDGNTFFVIKSKNGKEVKHISDHEHEDEVLFKSHTKFKVVRAEQVELGYEIELEEI